MACAKREKMKQVETYANMQRHIFETWNIVEGEKLPKANISVDTAHTHTHTYVCSLAVHFIRFNQLYNSNFKFTFFSLYLHTILAGTEIQMHFHTNILTSNFQFNFENQIMDSTANDEIVKTQ